jgi:hypothetical protein
MHNFIVSLIQLGACIQGNDDAGVVDASTLVDQITDHGITDAIREMGDAKFIEAMDRLGEVRFVNLVRAARPEQERFSMMSSARIAGFSMRRRLNEMAILSMLSRSTATGLFQPSKR